MQTDTLRPYFEDVASCHPVSRQREQELAILIQQGNTAARDELVQANLRFVARVAMKYQHLGLTLADLISAGNLGLLQAAERFDPEKGYKFISYAVWWIKQTIVQALSEQTRTVRLPMNKVNLLQGITKTTQSLTQDREREPEIYELAEAMDVSAGEIEQTLVSAHSTRSLDELAEGDDEYTLQDLLAADQPSPDQHAELKSSRALLDEVLASLNPRERFIIRLYFGLEGGVSHTLEEIGEQLDITQERVRQIKEKALSKLSHPSRAKALQLLANEF